MRVRVAADHGLHKKRIRMVIDIRSIGTTCRPQSFHDDGQPVISRCEPLCFRMDVARIGAAKEKCVTLLLKLVGDCAKVAIQLTQHVAHAFQCEEVFAPW